MKSQQLFLSLLTRPTPPKKLLIGGSPLDDLGRIIVKQPSASVNPVTNKGNNVEELKAKGPVVTVCIFLE